MTRKTILLPALAAVCLSCTEADKISHVDIPDEIGEGSALSVPAVRIIDVRTDGFTANWEQVSDALQYEYVFDEGDTLFTQETNLIFSGLEVNTEHNLTMRALPREESGRTASKYVHVNVVTSEILPLDSPALTAGSTFSSTTVISWEPIPGAAEYEWTLASGGETVQSGRTSFTFVTFKGLAEGREYRFEARAIPQDGAERSPSAASGLDFTPVSDGSETLLFSDLKAGSDAISFDVYANSGQYYWYDIIPLAQYREFADEQSYLQAVLNSLEAEVKVLTDGGTSSADAWAETLHSGSQNVVFPAYASLSYSITVFGMNLEGQITTEVTRQEMTTPSDLDSDGPSYKSEGDWFGQSVFLGTNPTTSLGVKRSGTNVASLKYLLYSSAGFKNTFGSELTAEVIDQVRSYVAENGNEYDSDAIAEINSSAGKTGYYSNRTPGTGYTAIALASNTDGAKILCINSITMRSTTDENRWLTYAFSSIGSTAFTVKISIADGLDAVSGKFFIGDYDEVTASYSKAQYRDLVLSQGRDLTSDETNALRSGGSVSVSESGLVSGKSYIAGFAATNSTGDTTVTMTGKVTMK